MGGRHFTAASGERIYVGAAGLNGLDFRFGTMAAIVQRTTASTGNTMAIMSTNDSPAVSAGTTILWLSDSTITPAYAMAVWDGANYSAGATAIPTTNPYLVAVTISTGTAAPREHLCDLTVGTWTHANMSASVISTSSAQTSLTLGGQNDSTTETWGGDMWQLGIWSGYTMSDLEIQGLQTIGGFDWRRLGADFYERWTDERQVGDMANSLGRLNVRQTTITGTTLGTATDPPSLLSSPDRRRR